jgi:hypothetical protein
MTRLQTAKYLRSGILVIVKVDGHRVGSYEGGSVHNIRLGHDLWYQGGVYYWWDVRVMKEYKPNVVHKSIRKRTCETYMGGTATQAGLKRETCAIGWRELLRAIKNGAEPVRDGMPGSWTEVELMG